MLTALALRLNIPRWAALALIVALAALVIYAAWSLFIHNRDAKNVSQVKHSTKTAEKQAEATADGIATVTQAAKREADLTQAITAAQDEIMQAPNPEAAREAVISAACQLEAYRKAPECAH